MGFGNEYGYKGFEIIETCGPSSRSWVAFYKAIISDDIFLYNKKIV